MDAYINIGSNMGDRYALIEQAVALVIAAFPGCPVRRSRFFESSPWGYESGNPYINLGLAIIGIPESAGAPGYSEPLASSEIIAGAALRLMRALQYIEMRISPLPHRNADGSYRDRPIDIDIIAIDDCRIDLPELQVPHPRARLRDFVMVPLADVAPAEVVNFVKHQQ